MTMRRLYKYLSLLFAAMLLLPGCRYLVDEDLADCGGEISIYYRMCLITNMQTEMETVLNEESDVYTAAALKDYLKYIFSDIAHDVDFSFYSPEGAMPRKMHFREVIDANQAHYRVYLPEKEYIHTCVANMDGIGPVTLQDTLFCKDSKLLTDQIEEVACQETGVFTSRLNIKIQDTGDQTFYSYLYMANSATALVLDTSRAGDIGEIEVATTGFADRFDVADSTYFYNTNYIVRPNRVPVEGGTQQCFVSVNFPSRDSAPVTKAWGDDFIWKWRVRVPLSDGTVTETILGIKEPLYAAHLKIIKVKVLDNGVAYVEDPLVGASVTLGWNEAGQHDIEF